MNEERKLELLAYAKVCFEKCTNPFAAIHLIKKNVTADECRELSHYIADIIEDHIYLTFSVLEADKILVKAEKEFMETQET